MLLTICYQGSAQINKMDKCDVLVKILPCSHVAYSRHFSISGSEAECHFDISLHIFMYCSPTRIPNRDKKTESPYLVHPLTYRQVHLTKDAYFVVN